MGFGDSIMSGLRRGLDVVAHGASAAGYGVLPRLMADWRHIQVQRDVPYLKTGETAHLLDIYRHRDARGSLPAVVYIHGGAFSMMSKDTHRIMAYVLASRGYQVFNINYRLGPRHCYPEPLQDAAAALHWVFDHGGDEGADLDKLVVMGESAGANLTAALTYCATHPRPEPFARELFERAPRFRCVAPLYGILDLTDMERFWRDPRRDRRLPSWIKREIRATAKTYLGDRLPRADEYPLASPLRLLEERPASGSRSLPPFFSTVGTADPLMSDTIRLREALTARETECEIHVFRGEMHAFNVMLWREAARSHWRALFRFLQRHVHAAPVPTVRKEPRYVSLAEVLAD